MALKEKIKYVKRYVQMKRGIYALLLLALVLTLSGCSGGRPSSGADNDPLSDTAHPVGSTIRGGEIVVGIAQDLDSSLDPHQMIAAGTAGTREVLFNVFEGLVRPTPDGELVPAVAESFVIDGTRHVFTLREGVRFHNGDLVTVEDIVYSINRSADASNTSTFVSALSVVTDVDAISDREVVIEIEEQDNEFIAHLTVAIIPAGYDNQARHPVGTGPFRFVSFSPQEYLILERFEEYWGSPAYLDRVTFHVYGSVDAAILAMNAGAIDIASHFSVDQVRQLSDDFYVLEGSMNLVQALFLNNLVPPMDDLRVRQALSYAVDIRQIMDFLADGRGSPIGSGMHPAFTRYFNADLIDFYPHDPERAMALLAEAGLADGFDLQITVPAVYTPHVITAEVIVEQLRAVGVRATINQVEWTYWVSEVNRGRNFESTIIGLDARNLTAHSMLERYVSDNGRNFINFDSAEFDEVFLRARAASDDAERVSLYMELQEILAREAASVFLQDLSNLVAINRQLAGFQFYPLYVIDLAPIHFVEETVR